MGGGFFSGGGTTPAHPIEKTRQIADKKTANLLVDILVFQIRNYKYQIITKKINSLEFEI
ncbi:MAG TPA: hypothetical protein DCQ99_05325 [Nitrospinae bacterium]|nr:hypothetical protein [Nitrospinota bacterium]